MAESKLIPEETEMIDQQAPSAAESDHEQYEEEKFDEESWNKVGELHNSGIPWNKAIDQVRADRLIAKYGKHALFVIISKWPVKLHHEKKLEYLPSLEFSITKLTEIILERDPTTYKEYRARENEFQHSKPTLLHFAAAQNFLNVAQCLVKHNPDLIKLKTRDTRAAKPVEYALEKYQDDTAAYLLSLMEYDDVQELFKCKDENMENNSQPLVKFSFGKIISYLDPETNQCGMKKTVTAVLNKLVKPSWPYLSHLTARDESNKNFKLALESVADEPLSFDFQYHVLETDENGRQPRVKVAASFDEKGKPKDLAEVDNKRFNNKSVSCLRRIADSNNTEAIQHPVVRMLVKKKWKKFAHKWFCIKAGLYLLFLVVLSFALIYGSTRDDPTQYKNQLDNLRAVCEIFSIGFLMLHLFDEIGEMARFVRNSSQYEAAVRKLKSFLFNK